MLSKAPHYTLWFFLHNFSPLVHYLIQRHIVQVFNKAIHVIFSNFFLVFISEYFLLDVFEGHIECQSVRFH